jgi:HlyD family secretion protein
MDVVRPRGRRVSALPFAVFAALGIAALGTYGALTLAHPSTISPSVERAAIVTDAVRRGTLVRSVGAPGSFVPARIAIVAAPSDGLIATVLVRPGTHVNGGTPIAELRNPDLEADLADLDAQIAAANAQARAVAQEARAAMLQHQSALRGARADREEAATQLSTNTALHDQGLIGDLQYRVARIRASSSGDRERIEASSVSTAIADGVAKVAAQHAVVDGLIARRNAKRAQLAALAVLAGESGVVQTVTALVGARVSAGTELARIAGDQDLEAVLQVADTDARGVVPGLLVRLDTGTEHLAGTVSRIEPAAQNGTVPVHVALAHPSSGARPQMHVEGAIELGRIANTISIARPAGAADDTAVDLYRLDLDGRGAQRVHVRLGRGPADRVQVRAGLAAGDVVIVSDVTPVAGDAAHITLR